MKELTAILAATIIIVTALLMIAADRETHHVRVLPEKDPAGADSGVRKHNGTEWSDVEDGEEDEYNDGAVIVSPDYPNPRIAYGNILHDSCVLAVLAADRAQDMVDRLEPLHVQGPPPNLSDEELREWVEGYGNMMEAVRLFYGLQEIASAVCLQRDVVKDRVPDELEAGILYFPEELKRPS